MDIFHHTLVCDGPTDANLIPILDWLLQQHLGHPLTEGVLAPVWRLENKPKSLSEKISRAIELYPCELLFVHRDAEKSDPAPRHREIREAVEAAGKEGIRVPAVAVVPVRMLEAWLLFDEQAIRSAAGNPNGKANLDLPGFHRIEDRPDPKEDLRKALRVASELQGRRLKKFDVAHAFSLITNYANDFAPLRQLKAFRELEQAVATASKNNWAVGFYGSPQD